MSSKLLKKIGMDIGYLMLRGVEMACRTRGHSFAPRLSRSIGSLIYKLGIRKKVSLENARIVFPDLSDKARLKIIERAYNEGAAFWLETTSYAHNHPGDILRNMEVEGRCNLDRALAKGRGVMSSGIHLGSFPLQAVWMTQAGYNFNILSRYPHDERVIETFRRVRQKAGIRLIRDLPRRQCARDCTRALKNNEIIFFQLDQRAMQSKAGVDINFFGHPYHSFGGLVSMAKRANAPLVPMYMHRVKDAHHRLVIEPEIELVSTGDKRNDDRTNLELIFARYETWIRAHPESWWWPNKRW